MDKETTAKVARLARIKVTDEQIERYSPQLSTILEWIEQLSEVDTNNTEPLPSPVNIDLRLRKDEVTDGGYASDVLANAPEEMEDFFVVPKVVE
jgi:aspartyl-tRNA(Asn)/glutamyl-tRNA(Gln) amidotransferase subunit C